MPVRQGTARSCGTLKRLDVRRVGALRADLGVVADLRAFGEGLEAIAGDAGVVHEQVLALVVGRDEAEALVVAEPLHGSGGHMKSLPGGRVLRNAGGAGDNHDANAGTALPDANRPARSPPRYQA